MSTRQQLDSFYDFASCQVESGDAEFTIDELYGLWRAKNLPPDELAESVAAIKSAYAGIEAGDQGRPAREELRETCERLGLVLDE